MNKYTKIENQPINTNLEEFQTSVKKIKNIEKEVQNLKEINKKTEELIINNYDLINSVYEQNDTSLKSIEIRINASLKFLYISIGIVVIMIAVMLYAIISMHFM